MVLQVLVVFALSFPILFLVNFILKYLFKRNDVPSSSFLLRKYLDQKNNGHLDHVSRYMLMIWYNNVGPKPIVIYNNKIYHIVEISCNWNKNRDINHIVLLDSRNKRIKLDNLYYLINDNDIVDHNMYFTNDYSNDPIHTHTSCVSVDCIVTVKCIHGKTISKNVGDLTNLDYVLMEDGSFKKVEHIFVSSSSSLCVFDDGLKITDHHPIKNIDEEWIYPIDQHSITKEYGLFNVASILLSESTDLGIMINNIPVCALGHGHINPCSDSVLSHIYYGCYFYWYIMAKIDEM